MTHPMRTAELHTFKRQNTNGTGHEWLAQFHPYKTYPVVFSGGTEAEAIAKAEALRAEAIEKHEADCIRRKEQGEKAKARAEAKRLEAAE